MGRDTLRQLEDQEIRIEQSLAEGKLLTHLKFALWLLRVLINHEKRLLKLEKSLDK